MTIKPTHEREHWLNILIYGDPGTGKTVLAATASGHEDLRDVLFVNVEGGMLSIRNVEDVYTTEQVKSTEEVSRLFWSLANDDEYKKYNTVVIDSITELQTVNLEEIARKAGRGVDQLQLDDYGKSTAQLRHLVRMFRDLDRHLILTALVTKEYPDKAGKNAQPTDIRPQLTGKLASSVMGYMDAVWYLYVDEAGTRQMLTQPRPPYRAKTRGQEFAEAIGERVSEPNIATLFTTLKDTEQ